MERMLKSVPDDLRMRMEALVHDLTTALEETSRTVSTRRRWGLRRRARSTGNLPVACHRTASDDSSSSIGDVALSQDKGLSSLHQSDSDEPSSTAVQRQLAQFSLRGRRIAHLHGNIESDSFNENFSPIHPSTRRSGPYSLVLFRKRKLKRIAVDTPGSDHASTSRAVVLPAVQVTSSTKKKRILRHAPNCENRFSGLLCGKRKRSLRERSSECSDVTVGCSKNCHKVMVLPSEDAQMDCTPSDSLQCEMLSSSSLSSSESDTGIYTNDEGREGDDEQSDWPGGHGLPSDTDQEEDLSMQTFLAASAAQGECMRDLTGREIRAGRRRVRNERPGFSIQTSANEKLSRFLQDPLQTKLRLHPMQRREREQLCHLANLYSLDLTSDLGCPILTKTRDTVRGEQVALGRLRLHHGLGDCKRRRRLPPNLAAANTVLAPPTFHVASHSATPPTPGSVFPSPHTGHDLPALRGMHWESSVQAPTRTKYHGHKSS